MNSVCITGRLRENIDEYYRNFEFELPYMDDPTCNKNIIPVKFWSNQPNSRLNVLPDNARVIIHAHLDGHEKFGTILVVEQLEVVHK